MDKVQFYVIVCIIISVLGNLLGILNAKNGQEAGQKLLTWVFGAAVGLPVFGRIFLWW